MDKALSLDGQRRDLGLGFRQVSGLTGLAPGTAHRAITDPANAKGEHIRRVRRALGDEARIRRSSDPALLRHVMGKAVPFMKERLGGRSR